MKKVFGELFAGAGFFVFIYHLATDGFLDRQLELGLGLLKWQAFVMPIALAAVLFIVAIVLLRQKPAEEHPMPLIWKNQDYPTRFVEENNQSFTPKNKAKFDRHFWRKAGDLVMCLVAAAVVAAYVYTYYWVP